MSGPRRSLPLHKCLFASVFGMAMAIGLNGCSMERGTMTMTEQPAHPGEVRMIDVYDKSVRVVPASSLPIQQQFVLLDKDGVRTTDAKLATQYLPITLVRILRLDEKGELVPADRAVQMRIMEYGADERLLRSTTMVKD